MYYRYQNNSHYGVNHNFGANYQSKKSEFVTSFSTDSFPTFFELFLLKLDRYCVSSLETTIFREIILLVRVNFRSTFLSSWLTPNFHTLMGGKDDLYSELLTEKEDKLQVSTNRGCIPNRLGTYLEPVTKQRHLWQKFDFLVEVCYIGNTLNFKLVRSLKQVRRKWKMYGRYIYYGFMIYYLIFLIMLTTYGLQMTSTYENVTRSGEFCKQSSSYQITASTTTILTHLEIGIISIAVIR